MSMSFGLAATLSNSQKLTPQMQQAIKLLQLSSLELAQEVQAKLDSNPLLECIEDDDYESSDEMEDLDHTALTLETWNQSGTDIDSEEGSYSSEFSTEVKDSSDTATDIDNAYDGVYDDVYDSDYDSLDSSYDGVDSHDSLDKLQQATIDDSAIDHSDSSAEDANDYASGAEDNYATSAITSSSQSSHNFTSLEDMDSYQGGTSATIQDHVRWQLNFKRLSESDKLIAEYLMDSMDDMGFVRLDIDELLQSLDMMASFYQWAEPIEHDEIMAVLRMIQSCDPLGVGARHLSECLALQLAKLDPATPHLKNAQALLKGSEHLVSNNIKTLTEQTGLAATDITPALTLLRTLNPSPGLLFQSYQPDYSQVPESYDIPDVLVTPIRRHTTSSEDEGWHVRLNPDTLPKLRVNQEYAQLVKRGDDSPDNQYLRENLTDARLFIRSIEERNHNLLKVATSIVRHQQAFLQQGPTAMQPLILKSIAEEVDLHESTVSRLTTSKTILTPQGLFSLKHFFSSHVSSSDGDISSTAISAMIKQLISTEDPKKPLSDSRIQAQLLTDGIDIARRTVAKYREAMNIGSSTQRKQKY